MSAASRPPAPRRALFLTPMPTPMRQFRPVAVAAAAALVAAAAPARAAGAQPTTTISFDAVPAAGAGAFLTTGGYTFTNFLTLETGSSFGTGSNGAGARFAYVGLDQGFGSVRNQAQNFFLESALLSFRAFDGNTAGPLAVTINGYRGFDPAADPVFTQTVLLTNAATLFTFSTPGLSEVEFLTDRLEANGRRAVLAVDNLVLTAVPEPATVVLLAAGGAVLAVVARRRRAA